MIILFESDPTLALYNAVLKRQEGDKTLIMTSKTSGHVSVVLHLLFCLWTKPKTLDHKFN